MSASDKAWSVLKNQQNPQETPTEQIPCPHCEGSGVIDIPWYMNARRLKLIEDNPKIPESYFNHMMMAGKTNGNEAYSDGDYNIFQDPRYKSVFEQNRRDATTV